jgi:hypothetical protein
MPPLGAQGRRHLHILRSGTVRAVGECSGDPQTRRVPRMPTPAIAVASITAAHARYGFLL